MMLSPARRGWIAEFRCIVSRRRLSYQWHAALKPRLEWVVVAGE